MSLSAPDDVLEVAAAEEAQAARDAEPLRYVVIQTHFYPQAGGKEAQRSQSVFGRSCNGFSWAEAFDFYRSCCECEADFRRDHTYLHPPIAMRIAPLRAELVEPKRGRYEF